MKISIGTNIVDGPGGGIFAINLSNYLKSKGHDVVSNLDDDDIDLILMMNQENVRVLIIYTLML